MEIRVTFEIDDFGRRYMISPKTWEGALAIIDRSAEIFKVDYEEHLKDKNAPERKT